MDFGKRVKRVVIAFAGGSLLISCVVAPVLQGLIELVGPVV